MTAAPDDAPTGFGYHHAELLGETAREYVPSGKPAFLIDGLVSSSLTLLTGAPKAGKTILVLHMAHALLRGSPFLGREVDTSRRHLVLWAGTDPDWRAELRDVMDRHLGAPDELLDGVRFRPGLPAIHRENRWSEFTEVLLAAGVSVLVVDNLWGVLGDANSNAAHEVSPVLDALTEVADRGIAVVLIHHAAKGAFGNPTGKGSGSPNIEAKPRMTLCLGDKKAAGRKLTIGGNRVAEGDVLLDLAPDRCHLAPGNRTSTEDAPTADEIADKKRRDTEQVRRFLREAPDKARQDASKAGRWLVTEATYGVTTDQAGRKKVNGWVRKHHYLDRDGPGGPLIPGPALSTETA